MSGCRRRRCGAGRSLTAPQTAEVYVSGYAKPANCPGLLCAGKWDAQEPAGPDGVAMDEHSAVGLAAAPSVVFWGWVGRRWSVRGAFAVACLVAAGGVAMSVLVAGIWPVLLAAGLLGGTFVGLTALGLVSVRRMSVGNPRRNLALMTAAFGLGQMVGPTFAGVLHDSLGSYQVPSLFAAFALVAAAVLGGGLPRGQGSE